MDLATIEMDPELAETKYREYQAAVKERHDAEDAAIAQGYKALARGQRLIELKKVIRAGGTRWHQGWFGNGKTVQLPRLAVGWADQRYVYSTGINRNGSMTFFWNDGMNPLATRRNVRLPELFTPNENRQTGWSRRYYRSMIPVVPPALRPAKLHRYHVLWEADWHPSTPPAPRDPALLKHIGGDLYVVVAVWDLTDLERAVLSGRDG